MRAGRNRRGFSRRDLCAGRETRRPRTNPGPEWMDLGGLLFLGCCLLLGWLDEGWSCFGFAGFLGLGLGWSE
jgi:hypothetical protein